MPSEQIKNALNAIPESEWSNIYRRLYVYSRFRIKITKDGGLRVIKGIPTIYHPHSDDMAKDFVQEAIKKLFSGERKTWKPKEPLVESLLEYLMGVIDSLLSAEVKSDENTKCTSIALLEKNDPENETRTHFQIADSRPTPEEQVLEQDEFDKFKEFCKNDVTVYKIFQCALEGIIQRREVAKCIGCTVTDVTNAKKRMKGMARQFFIDSPLFV